MPSTPVGKPVVQTMAQVDAEKNWVDVWMTCSDGTVAHKWYRPDAQGWRGPEWITSAL